MTVPILVTVFAAVVVFGQALYVRYLLAKNVNEVARACGAARATPDACGQLANWRMSSVARWCVGAPDVDVAPIELPGVDDVQAVMVEAHCQYNGGVMQRLLGNTSLGDLAASALVPY